MSVEQAKSFCQMMETDHALWAAVNDPAGEVEWQARAVELGSARGLQFTTEELGQVMGAAADEAPRSRANGVSGGKRPGFTVSRKEFPKSVLRSSVWPAPDW